MKDLKPYNSNIENIIRGLHTKDNTDEISNLISAVQDYEKYISDVELQTLEKNYQLDKYKSRIKVLHKLIKLLKYVMKNKKVKNLNEFNELIDVITDF